MQIVQKRMAAGVLAAAILTALMLASLAGACPKRDQDGRSKGKTTICHKTESESNPWVQIRVSNHSLRAHRGHGDVIPAPAEGCPSGDDGGGDDGGGGEGPV